MSGGNGGNPIFPDEEIDCASIFEETILNSPNPSILSTLKPDDELDVVIQNIGTGVSLVAKKGSNIAGSITSSSLIRIIECIGKGFKYIAIVVSVKGGVCRVQIRPKSAK